MGNRRGAPSNRNSSVGYHDLMEKLPEAHDPTKTASSRGSREEKLIVEPPSGQPHPTPATLVTSHRLPVWLLGQLPFR